MNFWRRIADTDEKLDQVSYYELLGVSQTASEEEIDAHYYKLAGRLHPDRFVGRSTQEGLNSLNRICARLAQAKKILLTPELRTSYDLGLAKGNNRLEENSDKTRKLSKQDPATPMARGLYDKAMAEIARGATSAAKAKLKLAKQYEPGSAAIAVALAALKPVATPPPVVPSPSSEAPSSVVPPSSIAPPSSSEAPAAAPSASKTDREAPLAAAQLGTPAPPSEPRSEHAQAAPKARAKTDVESQRDHVRQEVVLPVRLRIPTWERFEVLYTRDISAGGMFLRCAKPLAVGAQILLQLLTPNGETVEIKAQVAHVRLEGEGRASGMGLRFEEMSSAGKSQLSRLLGRQVVDPKLSLEAMVTELVRIRDLPALDVLGLEPGVSSEKKRLAYEALVRHFHPHRNGAGKDPAVFEICRELIACVRRAYEEVSKDPS